MKAQTTLKLLLLLSITATMAACGQAGDNYTDFASRTPGDSTSSTKSVAVCNQGTGSELTAKVKAGYNSSTSSYRFDQVLVRLSGVTSNFTSGGDYINMWRWMANTTGATYLDQTPLNFYVWDPTTQQNVTGLRNTLKWSDVSGTASAWGLSAEAFFQRVMIVVDVRDTSGEYDVIKITNYTSGNAVRSSLDMLLPLYYANPADYAYESNGAPRASVLQNLHPLKNMVGQGWSTSQFLSTTNSFCF